jgi:hypothetical protein
MSGFLSVRVPFPRNANAYEKMFWCVFEPGDVLAYVLFQCVTGYDGFSASEKREPVLAFRFLRTGARRWFQFLGLSILKTLGVVIHVPFATVINIEEYKSLLSVTKYKYGLFRYCYSIYFTVIRMTNWGSSVTVTRDGTGLDFSRTVPVPVEKVQTGPDRPVYQFDRSNGNRPVYRQPTGL